MRVANTESIIRSDAKLPFSSRSLSLIDLKRTRKKEKEGKRKNSYLGSHIPMYTSCTPPSIQTHWRGCRSFGRRIGSEGTHARANPS